MRILVTGGAGYIGSHTCVELLAAAGDAHIVIESFCDGHFPADSPVIKDYFDALPTAVDPDLVFTHDRKDIHQDHLTSNAFRDHLLLECGIRKCNGDLGRPTPFVPLKEKPGHDEVAMLLESFPSRRDHPGFRASMFLTLTLTAWPPEASS